MQCNEYLHTARASSNRIENCYLKKPLHITSEIYPVEKRVEVKLVIKMCIPFEVLFNSVLGEPRREVTHPEVSCFADHGGREGQPRWPRLYSSRPLFRGCGINFLVAKMASDLTAKITRSCLWPLI